MKLQAAENSNYAAVVVKLVALNKLENADNIVGAPMLGFQAIVSKDYQPGMLGLLFPAETQLSDEFCRANNLYRDATKNSDTNVKGYLEDNRRVKALKLRGHRSDCLFLPLKSIAYTGAKLDDLKVGDVFDQISGHKICNKYVAKQPVSRVEKNKVAQKFVRVDKRFMPEHFDSDNYWRNEHVLKDNDYVYVTQKLHGTSVRIGHTIVSRQLNWREKLAEKLFRISVPKTEFAHVYGSRKVIKDPNNPNQNHFYNEDIWTAAGKKLDQIVPQNFIVYGELIGWTPGGEAIQKNYTYDLAPGTNELYVYRIAFVNAQGYLVDLSWPQVKEFCRDNALKHVPELWYGQKKDLVIEDFIDKRFCDTMTNVISLSNAKTVDEGVCVRLDALAPYILKAKSPLFLQHETKMLDKGEIDMETVGSHE